MKPREIFTDDEAVSPVIGVILMVAITVILAAVIATFVLGLGESVSNTAPQASFTTDFDSAASGVTDSFGTTSSSSNGILTITHTGGDTVRAKNLYVTGGQANTRQGFETISGFGPESLVAAGTSVDVAAASDGTVRVVWDNGKGNSAELDRWEGPDA